MHVKAPQARSGARERACGELANLRHPSQHAAGEDRGGVHQALLAHVQVLRPHKLRAPRVGWGRGLAVPSRAM